MEKESSIQSKGSFWEISSEKTMNTQLGLGEIMKPFQKPHPEILCTALSPNLSTLKSRSKSNSFLPILSKSNLFHHIEAVF